MAEYDDESTADEVEAEEGQTTDEEWSQMAAAEMPFASISDEELQEVINSMYGEAYSTLAEDEVLSLLVENDPTLIEDLATIVYEEISAAATENSEWIKSQVVDS